MADRAPVSPAHRPPHRWLRASGGFYGPAVLALAAAAVLFMPPRFRPQLAWSDEVVYAVMARNIASDRGIVTNFYDPRALITSGYPSGDAHVPGHALFVAPFFRVLGSSEAVAFVPAICAFLLTVVLIYRLGRRWLSESEARVSSLLVVLAPAGLMYARSGMAEWTIVLLATVMLGLWLRAWNGDASPALALGLALTVGLLLLCRESLAVCHPVAVFALRRTRGPRRGRALLAYALGTAAGLLAFLPLYRARATFPHQLSDLSYDSLELLSQLGTRVLVNLTLPLRRNAPQDWAFAFECAVSAVAAPIAWRWGRRRVTRALGGFCLVLFVLTYGGLVGVYTLIGSSGARVLLFLLPAQCLLLAALVSEVERPSVRRTLAGVLLAVSAMLSWSNLEAAAASRAHERDEGEALAEFVEHHGGTRLRAVAADYDAALLGWRAYPVVIVWPSPRSATELNLIMTRLPVLDAVVVGSELVDPILEAAREGRLAAHFVLVGGSHDRRQLFLRADRIDRRDDASH
jgi:4-amino-4-deoxy-L-arabinose transferase-like glycosyltransferase